MLCASHCAAARTKHVSVAAVDCRARAPRAAAVGSSGGSRSRIPRARAAAVAAAPAEVAPAAEDGWLLSALARCAPSDAACPAVAELRSASRAALLGSRLPTSKDEAFRFTDLSPLTQATLAAPPPPPPGALDLSAFACADAAGSRAVLLDGRAVASAWSSSAVPDGVRLALLSSLSAQERAALAPHAGGSVFCALNGACCEDCVCLVVEAGVQVTHPVHLLHLSSAAAAAPAAMYCSYPRVVVSLGAGASCTVVEEFGSLPGGAAAAGLPCCVNSVLEASLGEEAQLQHVRVALAPPGGVLLGRTSVRQQAASRYALTSACLAGPLSRHDVRVEQLGPATHTRQRAFLLAGAAAAAELHTQLALEHPQGQAQQLHKCIVAAGSGRGVFDGGVRVGRQAQRTDAQQLSRSLLLAPRAQLHVKPNLQIVADDVKCTHGCTVADLSEEELFYFAARGIAATAARQALVYSFAAEVVDGIAQADVALRVKTAIQAALRAAEAAA